MLNLVSSVMLRDIFLKFPVLPSAGNKTATRRVVSGCAGSCSSGVELEHTKTNSENIRFQKQGFNLFFFFPRFETFKNRIFFQFLAFPSGIYFFFPSFWPEKFFLEALPVAPWAAWGSRPGTSLLPASPRSMSAEGGREFLSSFRRLSGRSQSKAWRTDFGGVVLGN